MRVVTSSSRWGYIIALSHKRYDERGGEDDARELPAGKGKKGALRSLTRGLSDVVFRTLVDDRIKRQGAGPAGHGPNPGGQQFGRALTGPGAADATPTPTALPASI